MWINLVSAAEFLPKQVPRFALGPIVPFVFPLGGTDGGRAVRDAHQRKPA